jgi:hypothetical protein
MDCINLDCSERSCVRWQTRHTVLVRGNVTGVCVNLSYVQTESVQPRWCGLCLYTLLHKP